MKAAGSARRSILSVSTFSPSFRNSSPKAQPFFALSYRTTQSRRTTSRTGHRSFFTFTGTRSSRMADVGPWGAWQVEPAKFTQLVVDAMRKL